jgi:hypothetical protein
VALVPGNREEHLVSSEELPEKERIHIASGLNSLSREARELGPVGNDRLVLALEELSGTDGLGAAVGKLGASPVP